MSKRPVSGISFPDGKQLTMSFRQAAHALVDATMAMHESGVPLMRRVLPADVEAILWDHYPEHDAVAPYSGARYFYHCHPVEERGADEHGHFHLFLPRRAMKDPDAAKCVPINLSADRADVVHIVGLSISPAGLPVSMFTVNRWVCDEWLYAGDDIMAVIDGFDLTGADGDPLVATWLTAMVSLARPNIASLLAERDARLRAANWDGETRALEVMSAMSIDLQALVAEHM